MPPRCRFLAQLRLHGWVPPSLAAFKMKIQQRRHTKSPDSLLSLSSETLKASVGLLVSRAIYSCGSGPAPKKKKDFILLTYSTIQVCGEREREQTVGWCNLQAKKIPAHMSTDCCQPVMTSSLDGKKKYDKERE